MVVLCSCSDLLCLFPAATERPLIAYLAVTGGPSVSATTASALAPIQPRLVRGAGFSHPASSGGERHGELPDCENAMSPGSEKHLIATWMCVCTYVHDVNSGWLILFRWPRRPQQNHIGPSATTVHLLTQRRRGSVGKMPRATQLRYRHTLAGRLFSNRLMVAVG